MKQPLTVTRPSTKEPAELELSDVSKVYRGGKRALSGISMTVGPGVLGLLGPNGAGKSSLMRIIATVTHPTGGRVRWNGEDVVERPDGLRRVLGYLPQDFGVYPNLTAPEFLSYLAAVKGLSARAARARVDELLELVNLNDARNRPLGKYSGGMRQRVGIVQALLNDPHATPDRRRADCRAGPGGEGEVPQHARRPSVRPHCGPLHTHSLRRGGGRRRHRDSGRGRLLRRGSPEELLRGATGRVWEALVASADLAGLRERHAVSRAARTPDGVRARVLADSPPVPGASLVTPDLEDAYLLAVRSGEPATDSGVTVVRERGAAS